MKDVSDLIVSRTRLDAHNWLIRRLQDVIDHAHDTVITHGTKAYRLDSQELPHGAGLKFLRMLQLETKAELRHESDMLAAQDEESDKQDESEKQTDMLNDPSDIMPEDKGQAVPMAPVTMPDIHRRPTDD